MKIVRPIAVSDSGSFTRASTATYFDKDGVLQTAGVNIPRFSYDQNDLAAGPTLLVEAAATNLVIHSTNFAIWGKSAPVVVTANYAAAPDLTTTASLISFSTIDEVVYLTTSLAVGTLCSGSIWVKGVAGETIQVAAGGDDDLFVLNGQWQRLEILNKVALSADFNINTYGGSTARNIQVWGAQLELGPMATSYIPTSGTTAPRAADVNTSGMLSLLLEDEYPVHDASKVYNLGERVQVVASGVHKIFESGTGAQSIVALNSSGTLVVTWAGHGLAMNTPISFLTTGVLPSPMVEEDAYYVSNIVNANSFQITSTINGSPLTVFGAGSGEHTATASANYNKEPLANPSVWLDAGSTNPWAMFDRSIESQTFAPDALIATIPTPADSLVDSVVVQNIENAVTARVKMVDPVDGVVYDQTISLVSDSAIDNWYSWFTEPIERVTDFALTDLPPYAASNITVSLMGEGETVKCGLCVLGL